MSKAKPEGDWAMTTIAEQFHVQLGKRLDAAVNRGEMKQCITNRSVRWGRVNIRESVLAPLTKKDVNELRLVSGDVLVCEGGEIGRASVWGDELPEGYYLNTLHRLRARGDYEPRLLVALLERWSATGYLSAIVGQSSIAHLTKENLLLVRIPMPPPTEQSRIAESLTDVDGLIACLEQLIAKMKAIKQGMMQRLLTGKTRLTGYSAGWQPRKLSELLSYEQPGPFLVRTTQQMASGPTPVLTAGKTFVLGYTNEIDGVYRDHPVIIFDDFTTASKFVDFDFKAKSSAMKILSARPGANVRFVYERMQLIDFPLGDHKRHWISEYSQQMVEAPDQEEKTPLRQC